MLIGLAAVSACERSPFGYTPIAEIVRAPEAYDGKAVKVRGTVSEAVDSAPPGSRYYVLKDGDVELTIFTGATVPRVGTEVSVVGIAGSASIVGGVGLGLHVNEQRRW